MMRSLSLAPLLLCTFALVGADGGCGPRARVQSLPRPPVPPGECPDLDESACNARNDCEALYVQTGCTCVPCDGTAPCEPCACDEPIDRTFNSCVPRDPCSNLDENACAAEPGCTGEWFNGGAGARAPCACEPGDPNCDANCDPIAPPPEEEFRCRVLRACEGLDEATCVDQNGCEPVYAEAVCDAECIPPPDGGDGCVPCDPVIVYDGCFPETQGDPGPRECLAIGCDVECDNGFVPDENGCPTCTCR